MITLAKLQKGMPADKKVEHDEMTKEQALKEARTLEAHATEWDYYGQNTDDLWARVKYFKLLAASKG